MVGYKPVIGFANQKGGVGKTTSAKMFSEFCASLKKKQTLGIDMDPQYSYTARFLGIHKNPITDYKEPPLHPHFDPQNANGWDGKSSIANIFFGEKVRPYPTKIQHLDIVPSDEGKLFQAENVKRQEMAEKVYSQLFNFINLQDVQAAYDIFVLDTPPAKGPLTIAAFKAMTHLVIPLEIELQAIEGLQGILQLWKQEALSRSSDRPLDLIGILPNKIHSRRGTDRDLLEELRANPELADYIMPMEIIDRKTFPEADLQQKSIFQFPAGDEARKEAHTACEYIFKRIFK
jgi:chromosome partitioning protein